MDDDLAIRTTSLTRRFGEVLAVDGLDLEVPAGRIYGFLGPNGSGKTTTIRLVLGLLRPDRGTVTLFGRPLAADRRRLLRRVGALIETPSLYDHLTGRDNLEITRRLLGLERSRSAEVLELVGLAEAADRRAAEYSLGMRQRLGLALALLHEPRLLVLDEPVNGLDPAGIHEVRRLLRNLALERGVTIFLSSHLLGEVSRIADHVGIVDRGRLRFQGPLERLWEAHQGHVALGLDRPDDALPVVREAGWTAASPNGGDHLHLTRRGMTDATATSELNALLVGRGFRVHHLSRAEPTLEKVFLEVTGGSAP